MSVPVDLLKIKMVPRRTTPAEKRNAQIETWEALASRDLTLAVRPQESNEEGITSLMLI